MLVGRHNEEARTWFRSDRVFHSNGEWFFHTREGIDVGAYDSLPEAEIEAGLLKELLKTQHRGDPSIATIREFILDSFSWGRPLSATCASRNTLEPGVHRRKGSKPRGRKKTAHIISLESHRR